MKHSLAIALALLCFFGASLGKAQASSCEYGRPSIRVSSENGQVMFKGKSLCDSSRFRIRVSNNYNGTREWYESNSGKHEWNINPNGSFSHTIARDYLTPGNLLQLITYDEYGHETHRYSRAIPCRTEDIVIWYSNGFDLYETVQTVVNCGNGTEPIPAPNPDPMPDPMPLQSCSVEVRVARANPQSVGVNVSCFVPDREATLRVTERNTGTVLCDVRFLTSSIPSQACAFSRQTDRKYEYSYELSTLDFTSSNWGIVYKDPSFRFAPTGHYTMPSTEMTPAGVDRKWSTGVSVAVEDQDVDRTENRSLIPVELVNVTTGEVVETRLANTGDTVTFGLAREYRKSWPWFGAAKPRGILQAGENRFRVRVRDAYSNTGSAQVQSPFELPEVTIKIVE